MSVDKITQMVAVNSPENQLVFIIQRDRLSRVFRCDLKQNSTEVIMKGKGPHTTL